MDTPSLTTAHADSAAVGSGALQPPAFIPFVFPGVPKVRCLFTTSAAGDLYLDPAADKAAKAHAREARQALLAACGLFAWVELYQVHGALLIPDADATDPLRLAPLTSALQEADGSATTDTGLALTIKTADCQPILLTNRKGTAVAALHVGWRGNAQNFPCTGVRDFCSAYGLRPQELLAVRGPSLGPAEAEFINFDKEWDRSFRPWFDEKAKTMDLWSLTKFQLMQAGMLARNIFSLDLCTKSMPGLFFSFRRQDAGRQMSLIWRE